MNSKKL